MTISFRYLLCLIENFFKYRWVYFEVLLFKIQDVILASLGCKSQYVIYGIDWGSRCRESATYPLVGVKDDQVHVVEGDEVVVPFPYGDVVLAMLALLFTYAHVWEYVGVWSHP